VNDGAKSAQLGALAFTAIGLFLLATAFSSTDEDLLLNPALTVSQLGGTAVPVVFAFGLAPAVFVAVYFYTLIRCDMLAGNIREFVGDLSPMVPIEVDRDRCRQLLANVEFVNALAMAKRSRASSWMFTWTVRVLLAVFPVGVLLVVQLQSLRLQSEWVSWTHYACLFADLVLLIWFFGRLRGDDSWNFWRAPIRRKVALYWLPAAVLAVDLLWLEVPRPASKTVGQDLTGYLSQYPKAPASFMERIRWVGSFQPIDLLLRLKRALLTDQASRVPRLAASGRGYWVFHGAVRLRCRPPSIPAPLDLDRLGKAILVSAVPPIPELPVLGPERAVSTLSCRSRLGRGAPVLARLRRMEPQLHLCVVLAYLLTTSRAARADAGRQNERRRKCQYRHRNQRVNLPVSEPEAAAFQAYAVPS